MMKKTSFFYLVFGLTLAALTAVSYKAYSLDKENKTLVQKNTQTEQSLDEAKRELEELNAKHEDLIEKAATEKAKYEGELKTAQEEKAKLNENIATLKSENAQIQEEMEKLREIKDRKGMVQRLNKNDQEIKRLEEENLALSKKLHQLYKTTNDKLSEINIAKMTLEQTIAEAKARIDQEWNTVDLGTIQLGKTAETSPSAPAKSAKKEGKIIAVNEDYGFVVVDLGKVDNIKTKTKLEVLRNNKAIANLSVLEIRDVMSACNVHDLKTGVKLEVNDAVLVKK